MFERSQQGVVDVVVGDTPINVDSISVLEKVLMSHITQGHPRIVLDLGKVGLIDSAGLDFLLMVQENCQRHGGEMKIANANPLCREILTVTGVSQQFEMHENPMAAVGSFVE